MFRVQGSGFRVQGSGFRVQGSGFRVQGSRFRVQGPGFRAPCGRRRRLGCPSRRGSRPPATLSCRPIQPTATLSSQPPPYPPNHNSILPNATPTDRAGIVVDLDAHLGAERVADLVRLIASQRVSILASQRSIHPKTRQLTLYYSLLTMKLTGLWAN